VISETNIRWPRLESHLLQPTIFNHTLADFYDLYHGPDLEMDFVCFSDTVLEPVETDEAVVVDASLRRCRSFCATIDLEESTGAPCTIQAHI
jgi:hypothetical protein